MTKIYNLELTGLRRINYYCSPSFWICDETKENKKILNENKINYSEHSFRAADNTICTRLEVFDY